MASIWDSIEEPEQPTASAATPIAEGSSNQPIAVDDSEENNTGTVSEDDTEMLLQEKETPSKTFGEFFAFDVARCADPCVVFVTGNANKLREVQQILAVGDSGIQVTNQALDGEYQSSVNCIVC